MTVNGEHRQLLIERPTASAHRRPMIIFLHGSRSSPQEIRDRVDLGRSAARANVLLVFPAGDPVKHSWRTGCCNPGADTTDFTFLTKIINALVADGEADPNHVVVGGFSAGGIMAQSVACRMAGLVSAVVSVSGGLLQPPKFLPANAASTTTPCAPSRPVTLLEIHGTADPSVPIAGSCRQSPCVPGVGGFLPSVAVVNGWWRQFDHCGAPAVHAVAANSVSLASCANGTHVGLALVKGAVHDLTQLRNEFPVRKTLIEIALGQPLAPW